MKCPECHFNNPDDTRFCGNCGTQIMPAEEISVSRTKTAQTPISEFARGSTLAGRYEIIENLGRGGMGNVYRVVDKTINEEMALKLINPAIASDEKTVERFKNELKFARKITHKNVCRMYDINESEGNLYITMEYVPGEDLKSMIRMMGQLSIGRALSIAKQVCEGLAEAHKLGVVHRDLKPLNIMIDKEGNARIMDFGIARSLKAEGITGNGIMIGTAEYMSPEQVSGEETDQRSDIYALGVILFEMLSGRLPFEGDTSLSIALKHKTDPPPDPREFNAQIPEDISRIILRCMNKDKEMRYQSAEEVFSDLRNLEEGIPIRDTVLLGRKKKEKRYSFRSFLRDLKKRKIIHTLAAFIAGGVAAVEFVYHILVHNYHFPKYTTDITIVVIASAMISTVCWQWFRGAEKKLRKIKVELFVIPIVILIAVFLDVKLFLQKKEPGTEIFRKIEWKNSIAVLPFRDISSKRDQEYLCEAMTDAIITKLGSIAELKITPFSSVRRYKNTVKNPKEIGSELDVGAILEPSLQIEGNLIKVNAQLINANTGFIIDSYEDSQEYENIFEIQDKISKDIALILRVQLVEKRLNAIKRSEPKNPEAFKYYAKARHFERKYRESKEQGDFEDAVKYYKKAVEIERTYALAYWGLGNTYQACFVGDSKQEDFELMIKNYKKAYKIDKDLALANIGLGWAHFYKEDLDQAFKFYKRALELESTNAEINYHVAAFLKDIGLYRKAVEFYLRAIEIDPLSTNYRYLCARCYMYEGEFEEAASILKEALELEPYDNKLRLFLARQLFMMKKFDEAKEEIAEVERLDPKNPGIKYTSAYIYAAEGEREKALTVIKVLDPYIYTHLISSVYSILGMKDEAIGNIQEVIERGFYKVQTYPYSYRILIKNHFYDSLRDDLRFQKILKKEEREYRVKLKNYGNL